MTKLHLVREQHAVDANAEGSPRTLRTPGAHLLDREPDLAARVKVDLVHTLGRGALPPVADDVEADHDGQGQVREEEVLSGLASTLVAANGPDSDVELGDENKDDEEGTEARAVDTAEGTEGKLLDRVTLGLPGLTETNVCNTDREPGEQCGETRQSDEPVEDLGADVGNVDVRKRSKGADEDEGPERTTGLVNVHEALGGVASLGKRSQGTRSGVDTRQTDGKNGDTDRDVQEVVDAVDPGLVHHDDERRELGTLGLTVDELGLVVRDGEADDEQGGDVDEGDTPEGVLDGRGERLAGVGRLSRGKTDELGTGKRERRSDEHAADSLEPVRERAGVVEVVGTDVVVVVAIAGASTADANDTDDDEDDDDGELEGRGPELLLGVTQRTQQCDKLGERQRSAGMARSGGLNSP